MADWVHCNQCFRQPGDGKKFSLTNCGHIYCDNCITSGTKDKCKMCQQRCTTIALHSKMKPEVELFFNDPIAIVKKHYKELLQVMEFQKNHRQRLTAYNRERIAKQDSMVHRSQKMAEQLGQFEREVHVLKQENSYLKILISNMQGGGQTGRTTSPGSGIHVRRESPTTVTAHRLIGSSPSSSIGMSSHHTGGTTPKGTNITPKRLLVRTPPVGGRMGGIPGTPSPNRAGHLTPGSHSQRASPMNISPGQHCPRLSMPLPPPVAMPMTPRTPINNSSAQSPGSGLSTYKTPQYPNRRVMQVPYSSQHGGARIS